MVLRLLPDTEALLVDYLLAHSSVAALVGTRVRTDLPADPIFPCLTLTLVSGDEVVRQHFDESLVQVTAWAERKQAASLLIRTARAVLLEAPDAAHARGVVTGVRTLVAPRWFPDDSVAPPLPRYISDLGVFVHPHPL